MNPLSQESNLCFLKIMSFKKKSYLGSVCASIKHWNNDSWTKTQQEKKFSRKHQVNTNKHTSHHVWSQISNESSLESFILCQASLQVIKTVTRVHVSDYWSCTHRCKHTVVVRPPGTHQFNITTLWHHLQEVWNYTSCIVGQRPRWFTPPCQPPRRSSDVRWRSDSK